MNKVAPIDVSQVAVAKPQAMQITVPAGVSPGQVLQVNLPDGSTANVTVPEGCTAGMTFTFMPPAAAPTAIAAPAAASTAIAVLEPSIIVAAPDDLEEFSMPRHENEFDETNDPHVCCLIVNILCCISIGGIIFPLLFLFVVQIQVEDWVWWLIITLSAVFACFGYFTPNICCTCDSKNKLVRYLRNQNNADVTERVLGRMQSGAPCVMMYVECYHYERRTTGSGKDRRTRRVRVVTHNAQEEIKYTSWRDVSTHVTGLGTHGIVRVSVEKLYTYADVATYQYMESARLNFRRINDRDRYQDYSEVMHLEVFEPALLCVPSGVEKPACMTVGNYFLTSFFCFNWCFRNFVERATNKTEIYICKQLSINQIPGGAPFRVDMDENVQYAVVYQQMYGRMAPNLAPEVIQAIPDASAMPVAMGYLVPSNASQASMTQDEVQALPGPVKVAL